MPAGSLSLHTASLASQPAVCHRELAGWIFHLPSTLGRLYSPPANSSLGVLMAMVPATLLSTGRACSSTPHLMFQACSGEFVVIRKKLLACRCVSWGSVVEKLIHWHQAHCRVAETAFE